MLIRKTQQPSDFPENQIHDAYSTSTTDTYSCNYLNKSFDYSTDERVVGVWVNGKPLYEKTIVTNQDISRTNYTVAHNIQNIECVFVENAFLFSVNDGISYPLNIILYNSHTTTDTLAIRVDRTNITFWMQTSWGVHWDKYITLRYTKTTD